MDKLFDRIGKFFGVWKIGVLDDGKDQLWQVDPDPKVLGYLKAKNSEGLHIFMRPQEEERFLLADDLAWPRIQRDHQRSGRWRLGRMCIETSPANYQVWMRSQRPLSLDEKRYWLERMGSDPGADPNDRWGRCPGFRNRKSKHRDSQGGYPLARLIWIDHQGFTDIPAVSFPVHPPRSGEAGGVLLPSPREISRSDYDVGNESRTDFRFAMALLRRGVDPAEVRERLLRERPTWNHHQGTRRDKYLTRTIERARLAVKHCPLGAR